MFILENNKDATLPNSLYDYCRLSEDEISLYRNEIEKVKITKANKKEKSKNLKENWLGANSLEKTPVTRIRTFQF